MILEFREGGMRAAFRVNEDRTVELVDFSAAEPGGTAMQNGAGKPDCAAGRTGAQGQAGTGENSGDLALLPQNGNSVPRRHGLLSVQVTGHCCREWHGSKHSTGSDSALLHYVDHHLEKNTQGQLLTIRMRTDDGLAADYHCQFYSGLQTVRTWVTLRNEGTEDIGIDYITSFLYGGLSKNGKKPYYEKTELYIPTNSWSSEAQWHRCTLPDVGISRMPVEGYNLPDLSHNRFHYGCANSWSTNEFLPMGMARDTETGEIWYFEIEHSGAWEIEYGSDVGRNLYVALLGPNEESSWWKNLAPGEEFETVPAAFGVCRGGVTEAADELTLYRRRMRRPNEDDRKLNIVFNDYMNCLMGDPTEEKEHQIVDLAAKLGCEYYCLDCGWYDKGPWWNRVGEWKESKERFPHGLRALCDYVRGKGMKMGLWLEIEVMGTACELAEKLPDDWFICTHGKRRIDNQRYLLDFRNPDVRAYCTDTVDRLIRDYGVEYFKIDYNVTTGAGTDVNSDSEGDGMLEHVRALYGWIRSLYAEYPDLVIENCGSGAQRQDYGILAFHSLQSTSDQTDYITNSYIGANVAAGVTPEQAGMWVYPYEDDREHVIYNCVNGLLLRPYFSGRVWDMSAESFALMQEAVSVYKRIRSDIPEMVPFWPNGFSSLDDRVLTYGLKGRDRAYLEVLMPGAEEAEIDLSCLGNVREAHVIYPGSEDCEYSLDGGTLRIRMPQKKCARLFKLS